MISLTVIQPARAASTLQRFDGVFDGALDHRQRGTYGLIRVVSVNNQGIYGTTLESLQQAYDTYCALSQRQSWMTIWRGELIASDAVGR